MAQVTKVAILAAVLLYTVALPTPTDMDGKFIFLSLCFRRFLFECHHYYYDVPTSGHLKNTHLHSCKHKTVKLKLTLTLTDTGGAVLTLMLGYRRLRNYKLKRKI